MGREGVNIALSDVLASAAPFEQRLRDKKAAISDIAWYPYGSISCLPIIRTLTNGFVIPANDVLDLGAADGDLSFLFADAGASVDALETVQTNFNKGEGLRRLNDAFGRSVTLNFTDVDFGFTLPRQYDLCLAAGIAYHLRNPLLMYVTLARHCRYMITNTRVIDITPGGTWMGNTFSKLVFRLQRLRRRGPRGTGFGRKSLAYFLDRRELNNDPTNYWLFSPAAYQRVLKRCGWSLLREIGGDAGLGTLDADKRIWSLCERVPNYSELTLHHDF